MRLLLACQRSDSPEPECSSLAWSGLNETFCNTRKTACCCGDLGARMGRRSCCFKRRNRHSSLCRGLGTICPCHHLFSRLLKVSNQWILPNRDQWKIIFMMGFLSTFLYQAFFMYGMRYTAAGDASLMITFNPLFTTLLAIPFLGENFNKRI